MRITLAHPKRFSKLFENATNVSLNNIITGISTDSRECVSGDLYVAIAGTKLNGNDYVKEAQIAGAICALVTKSNESLQLQQVKVKNPVRTIGLIANSWREQYNIPVIGITGSNGKTSTKDLVRHFLASKYNVHFTRGNFNTSIGVPLSLLLLEDNHDLSVIEMGANQPDDIKSLCQIVEPTHGLITNIGPAHLEGFGSIENVAAEKAELFIYLNKVNGLTFKNISDEWISSLTTNEKSVTYGFSSSCDFKAIYNSESDGNIILVINDFKINTKSKNVVFAKNILAAASVARTFNIDWETIQKKVLSFTPLFGRSVISKFDKITVIDDSYNANYSSTLAAIEHLAHCQSTGRRIFLFGDMAELGDTSDQYHTKVGRKCLENNLDAVFTVGIQTKLTDDVFDSTIYHKHFKKKEYVSQDLRKFLQDGDILLVKGSRSMGMETIIQEIFKK